MPDLTVVVPARDAAATLRQCLDGIAAQDGAPAFEVVVVDNGSRDGTADIAERHPLGPRVLRRARGEGPGAARNAGAAVARADRLAFTDADCRPAAGWLAAGAQALRAADLVQGAVAAAGPVGPFDRTVRVAREYGLYESANLFVRREAFEAVGGFEDLVEAASGRPFGEDVWFAWRLRRAGWRTAFAGDAVVHHVVVPGDWRTYLDERRREGEFCLLARRVPELRGTFFYGPWFFSRRSAALVGALAGAGVALRRRGAGGLLAAAPYGLLVARESRARTGVVSGRVAVAVAAGDLVALGARLRGSLRERTLLL